MDRREDPRQDPRVRFREHRRRNPPPLRLHRNPSRREARADSTNLWRRRPSRQPSQDRHGPALRPSTRDWEAEPQPVVAEPVNIVPDTTTRELPVEYVTYATAPAEVQTSYAKSPSPPAGDEEQQAAKDDGEGRQPGADNDGRHSPDAEPDRYDRDPPRPQYEDPDNEWRDPSQRPPTPQDPGELYDKLDFLFPRRPAAETSNTGDFSDPDSAEVDEVSLQNADSGRQNAPRATSVYSSHYTGDAELGGNHSATLTVLHDPKGHKQPLFRWLHIRQEVMNLDEFWTEVSRQPRLSEAQKSAMAKLRADLKKHCVKSQHNPKGARVSYMDPRYLEVPLPAPKKKPSSGSTAPGSVKWVCLPYFALQQYSGLLSASNLASFPSQTLLQSQYSRTPQQRDMDQAVSQLGTVKRGECFHIAQLWCLVLDNSFLFTCGSISQSDLQGEFIQIHSEPSPNPTPSVAATPGRILVSYGDSVVWSFTTTECPTWFSFLAHFQAFWPADLEFTCRDKRIMPEDWPKILKVATGPRASVAMKLNVKPQDEASLGDLQTLRPSAQATTNGGQGKGPTQDYLAVMMLAPDDSTESTEATAKDSLVRLREQLLATERFLAQKASWVRTMYSNCRQATRDEVFAYLDGMSAEMEQEDDEATRRSYADRVTAFNAADMLYRTFFPPGFDGPTIDKFWGAIRTAVQMPNTSQASLAGVNAADDITKNVKDYLEWFVPDIQAFQSIMSHANAAEQAKIELPRQFAPAWLLMISALLYCINGNERYYQHAAGAKSLIADGVDNIIEEISTKSLLDSAAILPMDVLALIAGNLLADQVGKADDICETYSQYLNLLDTEITTKPSDRAYQHRLDLVQQEMTAIKRTMAKQRRIIGRLRAQCTSEDGLRTGDPGGAAAPRGYYDGGLDVDMRRRPADDDAGPDDRFANDLASAAKLSATDAGGFRGLLLAECARQAEQREHEFRRYTEYGEDLERAVAYKMDWTKDRQENAIYAFTLVTIVFLPLSSIASIFGMNTTDVRDMPHAQWLYWAVALPVTLVVIVGGLWWMNELGNAVEWMTGRRRSRADPAYPLASVMGPPVRPPDGDPRPVSEAVPMSMPYEEETFAAPADRMNRTYENRVYEVPMRRLNRAYDSVTYRPPRPNRERREYRDDGEPRMRRRPRGVYRY